MSGILAPFGCAYYEETGDRSGSGGESPGPVAPAESEWEQRAAADPGANDVARLIAGLNGPPDSPLAAHRAANAWQVHQKLMDRMWRFHDENRGPEINSWSASEIGDLRQAATVFYPFGGPDFLFADAFFPGARRYVLCGLESAEPLPNAAALSTGEVERGLDVVRNLTKNDLYFTYFITKDMRASLDSTAFRGTAPLICGFLARTGHIIESVEPVGLDASGALYARSGGKHPAPGIRIQCLSRSGGRKEICYFQVNLADSNLSSDRRILKFAEAQGPPVTYLKCASYLMHGSGFSVIRDFIVQRSRALLQDPSGVPFRALLQEAQGGKLTLRLYGTYKGPMDTFANYDEQELRNAYEEARAGGTLGHLGFGIGYRFNFNECSLVLARR